MVDVSDLARLHWHGKWIWTQKGKKRKNTFIHKRSERSDKIYEEEKNVFCLLRHSFEVKNDLEKAEIFITADSRYKLFVNGKYVGRGINRCEAYYWYFNTYDITGLLKGGKNVVAIHARYYGQDFAYYTRPGGTGTRPDNEGKGGVLFDIKLNFKDGTKRWEFSGKETKIIVNEGERSDMPLKNDALGYIEEFDSRQVPANWNEIDFDDKEWDSPKLLDYPIKTLLADENHPLHEELEYPSEFIVIGENDDVNYDMDEEEKEEHLDFTIQHILEGPIEELEHFEITGKEKLLTGDGTCEIIPDEGAEQKVLSIFLKFPYEMVGYPQIIAEASEGTIIDIIPTEKHDGNLPRMDLSSKRGSRVVLRGGRQFFEQWDWEGYLYMLVKIRNITGPVKLHQVATNRTHMQIRGEGKFRCNDKDLNALWEACGLTVLCCAVDGYLDCPSREQRAYLGDAYPEALIANACFGEPRLTKKLIYDTAFGQRKDGITYSFHPGDAVLQNHIIPDYCFYWMQITKDYHLYYGDEQVLDDIYPHFLLALEWFWKYIDNETGLLKDLPYWTFIDWSFDHDKPGSWAILNTQFMDVLLFVASIAERRGDHAIAEKFNRKANFLRKKIDELFWDEKEGCYRDYYHEGILHQLSYMTNAYLVLYDITKDPAKIDSIVQRIFEFPGSEENIKMQIDDFYMKRMSHHAFGKELREKVMVAQPFFQHQVNKFFAKIGRFDLLLKYLYKWVPMLSLGETGTIWETWSIAGSECHAWAATPAYDLSTYWLGVKPASPGFETVEIAPTFHGLDAVEGIFPTCNGNIEVDWKKEESRVKINIKLPEKIEKGVFIIPRLDEKDISHISTGNQKINEMSYNLNAGMNSFTLDYK